MGAGFHVPNPGYNGELPRPAIPQPVMAETVTSYSDARVYLRGLSPGSEPTQGHRVPASYSRPRRATTRNDKVVLGFLVAPQGFEPRYAAPEAAVLPLNEGATSANWLVLQPDWLGPGQDALTSNHLDHHKWIRLHGQTRSDDPQNSTIPSLEGPHFAAKSNLQMTIYQNFNNSQLNAYRCRC